MPRYLLALYDDPATFQDLSPQELEECIGRYVAWGKGLEARGHLVTSSKLQDAAGRVLRRNGGRVKVVDGPFSETKEVLGGFFLIDAESYDQAAELAGDCPHLDYAGTIEIRQLEET